MATKGSTTKDSNGNGNDSEEKKYNIFRDSLLRYAGYANEVGESFRYQFPRFVVPTYCISFGYVFADAATTGYDTWNEYKLNNDKHNPGAAISRETKTAIRTMDVLLWQSLASVMIPGATINTIVKASRFAVARSPITLAASLQKWIPTGVGLGSIPLIIHPIDQAVDVLLDNTTRQWFAEEKWQGDDTKQKEQP